MKKLLLLSTFVCSAIFANPKKNETLVYESLKSGNIITAQKLLQEGKKISCIEITQLYQAGEIGSLTLIKPFLPEEYAWFIDFTFEVGNPEALYHPTRIYMENAIKENQTETIKDLLQCTLIKLNMPDTHGLTFLDHAINYKKPQAAQVLLLAGCLQIKTTSQQLQNLLKKQKTHK